MAASIWGTSRSVNDSLFTSGYEFEFFQAVRLLSANECEQPWGSRQHGAEPVRFSVDSTLDFPASPILRVDRARDGRPPRITVTFMGLIGSLGALPAHYTEMAITQRAFGDSSFAAFFDIFHHRLLSLFYRAWEKHRLAIRYEQTQTSFVTKAPLTRYLLDVIGMGTAGLQGRLPFADEALLRYAGLIAQRPRSAECLRALLEDFFGVPVAVDQFIGRWYTLEPEEVCSLGAEGSCGKLGLGAVAGDAVWNRSTMVRIAFGPLTTAQFLSFLPDGAAFPEAAELTRWFLGAPLDFDIQPVLAAGEVLEWCCLEGDRQGGTRLGWSTWLTDIPFDKPAMEAIFSEGERSAVLQKCYGSGRPGSEYIDSAVAESAELETAPL